MLYVSNISNDNITITNTLTDVSSLMPKKNLLNFILETDSKIFGVSKIAFEDKDSFSTFVVDIKLVQHSSNEFKTVHSTIGINIVNKDDLPWQLELYTRKCTAHEAKSKLLGASSNVYKLGYDYFSKVCSAIGFTYLDISDKNPKIKSYTEFLHLNDDNTIYYNRVTRNFSTTELKTVTYRTNLSDIKVLKVPNFVTIIDCDKIKSDSVIILCVPDSVNSIYSLSSLDCNIILRASNKFKKLLQPFKGLVIYKEEEV